MGRKEVTSCLLKAATGYLVKLGYSVHVEVGIARNRRVDVWAFNYRGKVVAMEIKSCRSDYESDSKWHKYIELGCCNKFYLVITQDLYESMGPRIVKSAKTYGAGVMVLSKATGLLFVQHKSRSHELDDDLHNKVVTKLAWRNGKHRGNTRRTRVYLT